VRSKKANIDCCSTALMLLPLLSANWKYCAMCACVCDKLAYICGNRLVSQE